MNMLEEEKEFVKNRLIKGKKLFSKNEFEELQKRLDKEDNIIYTAYIIGCSDSIEYFNKK